MKTIIYIDQNYLSNLTQARLGATTPTSYTSLWRHLQTAIQTEVVVCPFSPFRRTESELVGTAHQRDLYDTAGQIWCSVEFREFEEVLRAQVRASLKRFLGTATDMYDLSDAFTIDPYTPCSPLRPLEPHAASFASWTRWIKDYHEREGIAQPSRDFSAQKKVEAQVIIKNLYANPAIDFLRGYNDIFTSSALDFSYDLFRAYAEFTGAEDNGLRIGEFLRSEQMTETPFIDIHSSLVAGMITHSSGRKVQGSDLDDVLAISTVLPYCDILTTDRYMKDLACRLHLDDQYQAKVFSAAESDALMLTSLVRDLPGAGAAVSPPPAPPA